MRIRGLEDFQFGGLRVASLLFEDDAVLLASLCVRPPAVSGVVCSRV